MNKKQKRPERILLLEEFMYHWQKNYNFLKAQIPKTGVVISFSSIKKE
jgi:hypothetical protein